MANVSGNGGAKIIKVAVTVHAALWAQGPSGWNFGASRWIGVLLHCRRGRELCEAVRLVSSGREFCGIMGVRELCDVGFTAEVSWPEHRCGREELDLIWIRVGAISTAVRVGVVGLFFQLHGIPAESQPLVLC